MSARANHTIGDRVSILPCTSQRKTVACFCASVFVIACALNLLNREFFSKRNLRLVLSVNWGVGKNRLIWPLLEGRLEGMHHANQSL